jgi:L,D-peptidoglycan transpeptidase YkuD (ErfK/YbiS/YcfS/YnhG family)
MGKTKPIGQKRSLPLVLRPAPLNRSRGLLQVGPLVFPAAIGRTGRTAVKREGDGKTPITTMRVLYGFRRSDRMKFLSTALPMQSTGKGMLWCDAPDDACYNRPVRAPFKSSHEELMREDGLYDVCIVLDWNISSRRRHRGSAIFLHLIRPGYQPTAGCIALSRTDMRRVLPLLKSGSTIKVI